MRMRLGAGHGDPRIREFRDVTPLSWARRFYADTKPGSKHSERLFINQMAVKVLEAAGGRD
jgi:hypothetical protein